MLRRVTHMHRVWRPTTRLLYLLLLLLLPKQPPSLVAGASLLHSVSVSRNQCLRGLHRPVNSRFCAVTAVPPVLFFTLSGSVTRSAPLSSAEVFPIREGNFLSGWKAQRPFPFSPWLFHTAFCRSSLHLLLRTRAEHSAPTQTCNARVIAHHQHIATCCWWYSLTSSIYCCVDILSTAENKSCSWNRISTAAKRQLPQHKEFPAYFACSPAIESAASTPYSPATAFTNVLFTHQLATGNQNRAAYRRPFTTTFPNTSSGVRRMHHCTGRARKSPCKRLESVRAFTSVPRPCSTPRDKTFVRHVYSDSRAAGLYEPGRRERKCRGHYGSCYTTGPFSKNRGGRPHSVPSDGAAAVLRASAAAATAGLKSPSSPRTPASTAALASARGAPAAERSAAGGRWPPSGSTVSEALHTASAPRCPLSPFSQTATRVALAVSCRLYASRTAAPVAGGPAGGTRTTRASSAPASEAPEALPGGPGTSPSMKAKAPARAASPSPPDIVSYPFLSIEEKWTRYYAEHSDDFSPPLPRGEPVANGIVATSGQTGLSSSVPPVAPCSITGPYLNNGEFGSDTSHTRNSSALSDAPSQALSIAQEVDLPSHSPTGAWQCLRQHTLEKLEAGDEATRISAWRSAHVKEAPEVVAVHTGCSTQTRDAADKHAESAKKDSVLDPRCPVEAPRTPASRLRGKYGQNKRGKDVRNKEVTRATTDTECTTPCDQRLELVEHDDTQEHGQRGLKQANPPSEEWRPEEEPDVSRAAANPRKPKAALVQTTEVSDIGAAARLARAAREKRSKYYVLSMIPYPSGEGLHIGHCLTYTVADVVARYKRLQLRAELLWSEKDGDGGTETSLEREGVGEQPQVQQQLQPVDQGAEMQFNVPRDNVSSELCNSSGTNTIVEESGNGRSTLTYDQNIKQGSSEEAPRRPRNNTEAPLPRVPTHSAVEPTNGPAPRGGSRPACGCERPVQAVSEKGGRATLTQRPKDKYQVLTRAAQQPDVMHVMGWDAFGLPAEQHALASGIPPRLSVRKNIERFRHQLQRLGLAVDWRREIDTSDPAYFRWTQWIFLQMWKRGLVYEKAASVNWCEALGTVLADEEVVDGVSTRGQHPVEKRRLKQWHLRITAYADELENSLHSLEWPEDVKIMQSNWIGKRELLYVTLPLLRSSTVTCKRLLARESRDANRQAAYDDSVHASGESGICRPPPCGTSYVYNLRGGANSPQSDRTNSRSNFPPSHADQNRYRPASTSTTEGAGTISDSGSEGVDACSLRCVSISPEFLFGVTFVVVHAAHKQARVAAVTPAARGWLSMQKREPPIGENRQCASALHGETNGCPSRIQEDTPTAGRTAVNLVEARTQTGAEDEATVVYKHEDAVTKNNDCIHACRKSKSFFDQEAVFSGSYVKHPLTGAALPVWLFSGELFDQLRGAGTYFSCQDAFLVVPEHDSVAEVFTRTYGLPTINVLARGADRKCASNVMTRVAGGSALELQRDKHRALPKGEERECVDGPVQDTIINSQSAALTLNGLSRLRARRQVLEHLRARNIGEQRSAFALKDWVFSRQRFWGEPIPLVRAYTAEGRLSVLAESETNLPVVLPEEMYRRRVGPAKCYSTPTERLGPTASTGSSSGEHRCMKNVWQAEEGHQSGEEAPVSPEDDRQTYLHHDSLMAPLADYPQWWNLTPGIKPTTATVVERLPQHTDRNVVAATTNGASKAEKKQALVELQREVSTMPQWAGSSWYFLRFLDPHNSYEAFNKESARYWMPVDLYVGGKEHAVTHLLYARFWHKVLRDLGSVTCGEPFKRLCTPGIMLGTPQYVAFQRLDTGKWVSANSVSLKKGNLPESHVRQEPRTNNCFADQRINPAKTCSTTSSEAGPSVSILSDQHDRTSGTAISVMMKTPVNVPSTTKETAGTIRGTPVKTTSQLDAVAGVHRPSGQAVREVKIENAAVTHVKGSKVAVLKEDETIQVIRRYEKMSKSRGNVISPDSLIEAYGADALRLHLLFMGPVEARKVWSLDGIKGISRFLNRVWQLVASGSKSGVPQVGQVARVSAEDSNSPLPGLTAAVGEGQSAEAEVKGRVIDGNSTPRNGGPAFPVLTYSGNSPTADCPAEATASSLPLKGEDCSQLGNVPLSAFEKTLLKHLIERVTRHIERLAFNTALAALMYAVRKLTQWKIGGNVLSVHTALILAILLHPFAPFITEELWFRIHRRFPNVYRYASSPSLLACALWPTQQDAEINTHQSVNNNECSTPGKGSLRGKTPAGSEPTVDVGVHFDGKFHVRVQVPAIFLNDESALEEYVKGDIRVARIYADTKILRSVVLLKAKLVNFVSRPVVSNGDTPKKRN